jgi:hypothetical protein
MATTAATAAEAARANHPETGFCLSFRSFFFEFFFYCRLHFRNALSFVKSVFC